MLCLKDVCRRSGLKVGTYVAEFVTPGIGHILKSAGCDFLLLGMEHSGFTVETIKNVLRWMEAADLPTIVHVPTQNYADIARVCDVGAEGIMTPMTASVDEARRALDAIKYPPLGRRGCGMPLAYERHQGTMTEQITAANARTCYVPLIESADGVDSAEAIAALDGVDAVWVGQLDLSISLGIPNELDHPRFLDAARHVAAAARKHHKMSAILAANEAQGLRFHEMGYEMICYGEDTWLYHDVLRSGIEGLRQRLDAGT
jgi:2-keto-3-deoxy-L-rhamnonate aldolase RhmA